MRKYVAAFLKTYSGRYRFVSGESLQAQNVLSSNDFSKIFEFSFGLDLLVIDEAQDIENSYFWRTYAQNEIDYIEEKDAQLNSYEIKWNPKAKAGKHFRIFQNSYSNSGFKLIHSDNYLDFVS